MINIFRLFLWQMPTAATRPVTYFRWVLSHGDLNFEKLIYRLILHVPAALFRRQAGPAGSLSMVAQSRDSKTDSF